MKYLSLLFITACNTPVARLEQTGTQGEPGQDGKSCTLTRIEKGTLLSCPNGNTVLHDPENGAKGERGANGLDGESCVVTTILPNVDSPTGGASIQCPNSVPVIIFNGSAGADAAAYAIAETIDPCGPSGGYDEVLLRLASGKVVALFTDSSDATHARLSYLIDNVNYRTTDSNLCSFNLTTSSNTRTLTTTSPVISTYSWTVY